MMKRLKTSTNHEIFQRVDEIDILKINDDDDGGQWLNHQDNKKFHHKNAL